MKKFIILLLSLVCAFSVTFTACFESGNNESGDPNTQLSGGNKEEQGGSNQENQEHDGETEGEGGNSGGGEQSQLPEQSEQPGEGGEENQEPSEAPEDNGEEGNDPEEPENPEEPEEPEEPEPHVCAYSSYWSCNEAYHWHASTCSEHPNNRESYAAHNYVNGRCKDCSVSSSSVYKVGDRIPDFTFNTFKSAYKDSTYSLADARGKVLIINFWYVNCGPCVSEMPEIEDVRQQFGDNVVALALHSSGYEHAGDLAIAQSFIDINNPSNNNKTPWTNYQTIFGADNTNEFLYNKIGGDGYYPKTVVLNAEGIITSIIHGNIIDFNMDTYQRTNKLIPAVEAALKS